jgi:putative transposase
VRRAYKFRVYPTSGQAGRMTACLRDHQRMYNAALEERREAWRRCRVSISYGAQSAQLTDIRALDPGQGRWSFSSQQATLRRLDKAMAAFYRRARAGQKPGYPRFKARDRWDAVQWPSDGDGCKWKPEAARVYLRGIGHVKVRAHRGAAGRVKTITLRREGRRWYVIVSCDDVAAVPLPATGREVGVDVGVARFATASDGEVIASPRFARASAGELAAAQQALARKKRGSANRRRARARVGEVHRRIRNSRADFHHKTARALVSTCDAIALEDLKITSMTRSASGTLDQPGTNVAAKAGLNRSILDAGWGQFTRILTAKAEEAGRRIVLVDPRYTSITCHQCGSRCLRPSQSLVICPAHGGMDADLNAARNIHARAGLGSGQTAPAA